MRGRLLDRDKDGDGVVEAQDGSRHEFWRTDVVSERGLRFLTPVEFELKEGRAAAVRAVGSSPIVLGMAGAAVLVVLIALFVIHNMGGF